MLLIFSLLLIYYLFGWSYAIGAAKYARTNNNGSKESESSWQSVCDEFKELIDAIKMRFPMEIFMEFFDVVHALIKFLIVNFLPKCFYFHPICWLLVFPFILPIGIKLGLRYNKFGCIRNHNRVNKNHLCIYNKYLR